MTRVDGSEPRICNKCGQSSEDFSYPLLHPPTCRQTTDRMLAELMVLRQIEAVLRRRRTSEPLHSREDHDCSECSFLAELDVLRRNA